MLKKWNHITIYKMILHIKNCISYLMTTFIRIVVRLEVYEANLNCKTFGKNNEQILMTHFSILNNVKSIFQ